jgi:flagellar biosynthetic protein FliQ
MLVGLVVGVAVGLLQALTQIQEATLVFVPKILSIFVSIILLLPFMAATMSGLMTTIVQMIIQH